MKPLLAAATDGKDLTFPLYGSPKLDGVRALIIDGVVMSRSLKPIPNKHVQRIFGNPLYNGFDGELIVGSPSDPDVYRETTSAVMSHEGEPNVQFHVFDDFGSAGNFSVRLASLETRFKELRKKAKSIKAVLSIHLVSQTRLPGPPALEWLEQECLRDGYEGVMLRSLTGHYKHGRSTLKEGILLKLKRFADSEAIICGFQELMHNTNEAVTNELGHKERSSKKAGMVGKGILGAIMVRDLKTNVEFDIGTGFDSDDRLELWSFKDHYLGQVVKYKYFPGGVKDKPRFPVFLGFRNKIDL